MTYDPDRPTDTETRILTGTPRVTERASTTGWVVAAIVAVVAIIAVAFMVSTRNPDTNQAQIANALEQGRLQGTVDAQSSVNTQAAMNAQALNAQMAAERAAQQTQALAADARDSADQAAANVSDAARDANARIDAEPSDQTAPITPAQ